MSKLTKPYFKIKYYLCFEFSLAQHHPCLKEVGSVTTWKQALTIIVFQSNLENEQSTTCHAWAKLILTPKNEASIPKKKNDFNFL